MFVWIPSDAARDALSAFYVPMSVMLLLLVWVILLVIGFAMMFWAFGASSFGTTLSLSGSAITTNWVRSQKAQMPEMRRHSAKNLSPHLSPMGYSFCARLRLH